MAASVAPPTSRLVRHARRLLAVVVLALAAGCGAPANTAYLPVGSRCERNDQCGTSPYECALAGYPGGYCQKACTTDGDCPTDALCLPTKLCRRRCKTATECRTSEGYDCVDRLATATVCDIK